MIKRKIGLVIGTNIYAYPGIKNLEFAEADARAIKDVLLDTNLCGFDEVIEVIGGSHTEASEKIEKMLNDAEPDDFILLYFSGHGKLDMGGNLCLLFKDTKLDSLLSTSLHFDFINKFIKGSRCKTIIIIIDSCFSGAAGIRGGDELLEKSLESIGEGTIILSASRDFEPSKEDETLKHGVFTYYLWEGLKTGDADDNKDGLISIDELYRYANSKIKEGRYPQHPKRSYDGEGEIIIGVNPEIIKKNNFEKDVEKLIKKKDDGLPIEYYSQAMNILTKDYEEPLTLTDIEKKIQPFLESLLNDKMGIQAYITTIKVLSRGPIPPDQLAEPESQTAKKGIKEAEEKLQFEEKISELNSQAKKLFEEKKYTETIAKWEGVLKLDSENSEAIEGIEEAKGVLKEINELNIAAQQLHNEGKYNEAIVQWNEVLKLDPDNKTAIEGIKKANQIIELIGKARRLMKIAEAIALWQEVLKLDPKNREAIEGIEECNRILSKINTLINSSQKLYNEGKYRETIDAWKEVLNLDPENQTAKGGIKKAEEEEKKKQISELSLQAQKLFEEKKYTEAIAKWQEVLNLNPYNRKASEGKKEAERILKKLEQLYDEGTRAAKAKEWEAAIAAFRELVTLNIQYRDAAARLGEAEEKLKGIERKVKKYCPECGYPNEHGLKYCTKCGAKLLGAYS